MTRFEEYCAKRVSEYGQEKCDFSSMPKHFISAYNLGRNYRVKVLTPWGETKWGTIGATTGWRPSFILLHNRSSQSSSMVLDEEFTILESKFLTNGSKW